MKRVTGIGGIFFKAKDAPSLQAWYKRHLGIDVQVWGGAAFTWADSEGKPVGGTTIWSIGGRSARTDAADSTTKAAAQRAAFDKRRLSGVGLRKNTRSG